MSIRRRRGLAVDSHDASALRGVARRTRLLRIVLAAAAVVLLAAATASARGLDVRETTILPTESTGVVVLDLSLSITDKDYRDVRRTLRRLIADDARVGLVVFSDVPYELLPPGTPARELRPLVRLLGPPRGAVPATPWATTFRLGTRISSALALARDMLERDKVQNGSILLVSDLQTAPDDVLTLTRTLRELRRRSVVVRVAPLSPLRDGRQLFEGLLGRAAFAAPSQSRDGQPGEVRREGASGLPVGLLAFGGLLFAVLAANERFAGRLALPRGTRA